MNLIAKLLPQFITDLPPRVRQIVYAALVLVAVLLLVDYKFAAGSGMGWFDSHVVSAAVLAWYVLVVTPVLTLAHQKVELPQWVDEVWGDIDPTLTTAAAPAAGVPTAEIEAAAERAAHVIAAVPAVEAAIQGIVPSSVVPVVAAAESAVKDIVPPAAPATITYPAPVAPAPTPEATP